MLQYSFVIVTVIVCLFVQQINASHSNNKNENFIYLNNLPHSCNHIKDLHPHQDIFPVYDLATNKTRYSFCGYEEELDQMIIKVLRNKRIAFVGDSLTRYAYLDLIGFIEEGHWPSDQDYLCNERLSKDFIAFYKNTNARFNGHELCECYRIGCCDGWLINENRKYYHPEYNITIWFFHWFGDKSYPHGLYNISQDIQPLDCMPNQCSKESHQSTSWLLSPTEFIETFTQLHEPDYFIMNSGHHTHVLHKDDSLNKQFIKDFDTMLVKLKEKQKKKTMFIWKGTTGMISDNYQDFLSFHEELIQEYHHTHSHLFALFPINLYIYPLFQMFLQYEYQFPLTSRSFNFDIRHYQCWVNTELNKIFFLQYFYKDFLLLQQSQSSHSSQNKTK